MRNQFPIASAGVLESMANRVFRIAVCEQSPSEWLGNVLPEVIAGGRRNCCGSERSRKLDVIGLNRVLGLKVGSMHEMLEFSNVSRKPIFLQELYRIA